MSFIKKENLIKASEFLVKAAECDEQITQMECVVAALTTLNSVERNASTEHTKIIPIVKEVFAHYDINKLSKDKVVNRLQELGYDAEAEYIAYFLDDSTLRVLLEEYGS